MTKILNYFPMGALPTHIIHVQNPPITSHSVQYPHMSPQMQIGFLFV
jgi:hypothetical protein